MHSVPQKKLRTADQQDQSGSLLSGALSADADSSNLLQPRHGHQNEEAGNGRQVMSLERRKKVDAQREDRQSHGDPDKTVHSQAPKESDGRDIERGQEKEAIKANAIFQALEIAHDGLVALVKRKLHLVIHRLLRRQRAVRRWMRLKRERGWHAVLVLAELFG